MVDAEAVILSELERLAPADELVYPDWRQVLRRLKERPAPASPRRRRRRLVVAAILAGLVLVGVATATYLALRPTTARNGAAINGPVVIDIEGHGVTQLQAIGVDGRLRTIWKCPHATFCGSLSDAAWSPDGTRLALAVFSVGLETPYFGLDVANVRTGKLTHLTSERSGCGGGAFSEPNGVDWSRDGHWIAFSCDSSRIGVISPQGSGQRVIETGLTHVTSPSWSPDGKQLVFAAGSVDHSAIYLIDADGRHRRLIVPHGRAPAWSPTSSLIAYRGPSRGAACGGLRLVTTDGRDATPVLGNNRCGQFGPRPSGHPAWSPDGTQIAVTAGNGVYVVQADGSDLRRISRAGAYSGHPAWQPLHSRPPISYHALTANCPSC